MKEPLKLALFSFLLLLPWIFFDIDLGDQSYHSLGSWLMAFHPKMPAGELPFWFEQVPIWFSYFVDSLWWRVIGPDASLLFVRFGWLIFQVLVILGLHSAFRRLYPGRPLVGPLLLALLAVNCAADDFVLSYYVVPPAFGALAFAFLAGSLKGRDAWCGLLGGFFAALAIQSRIPAAVPLGGAFGVIFAADLWIRRSPAETIRALGFFLGGILLGSALAVAALFASGQAEYFLPGTASFWEGVTHATNQRYSKGMVWQRALGHYLRIAAGLALFLPVLLGLERLGERAARALLGLGVMAAVLLSVMKYGTVLSVVIGGSAFLVLASFWRAKVESWRIALAAGAFACLASFTLGTFLEGVQTFKYGLWLLVPLALLSQGVGKVLTRRWLPAIILALFFVTRILWPTFPYLERTIFKMRTPLSVAGAEGLFSYPEKAAALQELTHALAGLGLGKGAPLFVYAGVPSYYPIAGVYLLTRTVPLFHDPGIVEYPGGRWPKHKAALETMARSGSLPALVVRQKEAFPRLDLTPRDLLLHAWSFQPPKPARVPFQWSNGENNWLAGETDEILKRAQYRVAWESAYFVVLAKP